MIQVARISHTELQTRDLSRLIDFYTAIFGLVIVGKETDRVYLGTSSGQVVLVLRQSAEVGCSQASFQVGPQVDLGDAAKWLQAKGIASTSKSDPAPGIARAIVFEELNGNTIEIVNRAKLVQPNTASPSPIQPLKLGHIAFKVKDLDATQRFYCEILGFRVSDWRSNIYAFLRCGPDHHTVNIIHGDRPKLHHIAFELRDGPALLAACDHVGVNGLQIAWGPGRHIIGGNMFIYFRNPDSNIMELYADMAQMKNEDLGAFELRPWHWDRPYRPKDWPADTLGNLWGPPSPPGFRDG